MPKLQEEQRYDIEEFDFKTQLEEFGYYLILGKRRSGKTTLARLMSQVVERTMLAQHIVIAGNANIKKNWAEVVHPFWIKEGYTLDPKEKGGSAGKAIRILADIIRTQNERVEACDAKGVPFPEEWKVKLWIDDCGTMKKFMHSEEMKWLVSNGRQIKIDVFLIIQKLTHACTESRENCDGLICLRTAHFKTIETIWKEHLSTMNLRLFQAIFTGATQRRGCLIVNAQAKTEDIRKMLYFSHFQFLHPDSYKAKLEHVGSAMSWEYAEKYYRPPVISSAYLTTAEIEAAGGNVGAAAVANVQQDCKNPVVENDSDEDEEEQRVIAKARSANASAADKARAAALLEENFKDVPFKHAGVTLQFRRHVASAAAAG